MGKGANSGENVLQNWLLDAPGAPIVGIKHSKRMLRLAKERWVEAGSSQINQTMNGDIRKQNGVLKQIHLLACSRHTMSCASQNSPKVFSNIKKSQISSE